MKEDVLKVGVTGAGGVIGSALVAGLRARFDLKLFDLHVPQEKSGLPWQQLDCAQAESLPGAFDGLDAIIHLAGNPSPAAQQADTLRNNFLATSLVFEASRIAGVKKVVFASSNFYHQRDISLALRNAGRKRITLDACATPDCTYAQSKVFGENLGRHYAYLGLQCVALRIGWTVASDTPVPYDSAYMRAMFCSKRDLVQAFDKALASRADFLTAFAISNNRTRVFDLDQTQEQLGFEPQDDSASYF